MDQSLQFEEQLFIPDIKSIDINHISGPFFTDYQSLSLCWTLVLHLTLYYKIKTSNAMYNKTIKIKNNSNKTSFQKLYSQ